MKRSLLFLVSALIALTVVAPIAAEEATLETIIAGWSDALGGVNKLEAVETYHGTNKVTIFGLTGTLHEWAAATGQHSIDLDLAGMFKIVMVSDNGSGWMRDQNGKISPLAGQDLKGEVSAAYLATLSHLVPGRMPGTQSYEGTENVTGYHIVRVAPDGGVEVTFYLDSKTYLPVRSEQPEQDRTLTAAFTDWKEFGGVLFPTRINNSTGDPQHDQLFEVTGIDLNVTPTAGVFDKPVDKAQDYTFANGHSALDIPLELNNVHIFTQVSVNGSEPLWFILDTGASVTVLNTSTAKALGMDLEGKIEGRGAGEGSVEASLIPDVTFELPGVKLEGQTAVAISFDELEPLMGRSLDGVFGYDMISRFVVEIDYENKVLHLYDRDSYAYTGNGVHVPLHIEGSVPYVSASATMPDGRTVEGEFLIDTGAGATFGFTAPFTDKHELLESLPDKIYYEGGMGVGGESKSYIGRVSSVELGGLKFINPVVGFSQDKAGAGADPNRAGLIGGQILSRCTVVFDYDGGEMILEPNASFEDPYNFGMSGLSVQTGGRGDWETLSVRKVVPGSPAAEAGLEIGDVIEIIDGRPAGEYSMHFLNDYLKRDGQTVNLTIVRDGQTIEKKIGLKKAI